MDEKMLTLEAFEDASEVVKEILNSELRIQINVLFIQCTFVHILTRALRALMVCLNTLTVGMC